MLGADGAAVTRLANGENDWGQKLRDAKAPMLIVGAGALARPDGMAVLGAARVIAENFGMAGTGRSGFNVLHRAASRVAGLDMGFLPATGGKDVTGILEGCRSGAVEVLYLLGADELDLANTGSAFVIYQGHHGDRGAARADVVLPGCAYTEKDGTYVNTEGRAQLGRRAVFAPGEAREDWAILRAISGAIGRPLPFDSLRDLRTKLRAAHSVFGHIDEIVPAEWGVFGPADALSAVDTAPFVYPITDFYRTDPISRASPTMRECSEMFAGDPATQPRTGTHG
jgi:NADH-quinone oxidoreductase subunit G